MTKKQNLAQALILTAASTAANRVPVLGTIINFYERYLQAESEERQKKIEEEFRKKFQQIQEEIKDIEDDIEGHPEKVLLFYSMVSEVPMKIFLLIK